MAEADASTLRAEWRGSRAGPCPRVGPDEVDRFEGIGRRSPLENVPIRAGPCTRRTTTARRVDLDLEPCRMRLPIPPERPHVGPMKPVGSARTSQALLPNGQLELTIDHDTVRGVTPAMLRWWFENLGKDMTFAGETFPRYLLWHPRDHIHWALARRGPDGGTGRGAHFRIVEAFGANPAHYVDSTEYVEKLDEEGISLVRRVAGVEVFRLEHRFGDSPRGASYVSRMRVGVGCGAFGWPFNHWVRPRVFSDAMGTAWLTHNVEEVSMLENILPRLYASR